MLMSSFYRDGNGHVAMVYAIEDNQVKGVLNSAFGVQCFIMNRSAFMRKYTQPFQVKGRTTILAWYGRAMSKLGNDPRALTILQELMMEKSIEEMTMDEVMEQYNNLASSMGKPTVNAFKSLKAARAALVKLQTPPVQPKAANTGSETRGPVQGVGTFSKDLLLQGFSNKEVLAKVQENFPTAKTTVSCIAYYRSKLVLAGKLQSKKAQAPAQTEAAA